MEKNKIFAAVPGIILAVIFALPLPLSMVSLPFSLISLPFTFISWLGSIVSAAIRPSDLANLIELARSTCFILTMLLAGLYPCTYYFAIGSPFKSLGIPFRAKKISLLTFLPLLHIVLFIIFYFATGWLESTYGASPFLK